MKTSKFWSSVLSVGAGLVGVGGLLAAYKAFELHLIQAYVANYVPPPPVVETVVVAAEPWAPRRVVLGTLRAAAQTVVTTDVAGLVEEVWFQSGQTVAAGQPLLRLDSRLEAQRLAVAQIEADRTRREAERRTILHQNGVSTRVEWEEATDAAATASAQLAEVELVIAKKTIRAPFAGRVELREIEAGRYLTEGEPIVRLLSTEAPLVNFALPLNEFARLPLGAAVDVVVGGGPAPRLVAEVTALAPVADSGTRLGRVEARLRTAPTTWADGAAVRVEVNLAEPRLWPRVPTTALQHLPEGVAVLVVDAGAAPESTPTVCLRSVELAGHDGDWALIARGLQVGEEVVSVGGFKLRDGAPLARATNDTPPGSPAAAGQ